jgi:subtilase family serine protease
MRPLRAISLSVLASALLIATSMAQQFAATVRIVNPIDESQLVTLKGNTHPAATAVNDRGPVSPSLALTDLIMVLSRSPQQQTAFDKFVADQYNPNSPDFHHWLEPEEVGTNFGPSQVDIATISNWLTGHGFTIDEVSKDRMAIHFSGTAGQVQSAFHTEIHNLEVKGVPHIGNMSDPQIPAALAPAVVGVKALHNFYPRPQHKLGSLVQKDSATGKWQKVASPAGTDSENAGNKKSGPSPLFGINQPASGGNSAYLEEDVAPYDFAAMYNVLPLWNASTPINGTGQTIAIAGTSQIQLSDVTSFRSVFGLPAYTTNVPQQINANGTATECTSTSSSAPCGINDLIENTLDVEWSGAVAPGAQIVLVVSGVTSPSTDSVYTSSDYVIQHNTAKILSVSYGECELGEGTSGNVAYYDLWQTAATEGIAVFVATGDSGAPSCDDGGDAIGNPYSAQYGLSVSGLASTPYNTAVGGTDLNWCNQLTVYNGSECPAAPYWNTTNSTTTGASAVGYVPEVPWNDSCASPQLLTELEAAAKSSSYPTVSDAEEACNFVQTDWTLYANAGEDIASLIDTVGGSGGASGCVANSTSVNGTSFGTCTANATTTGTANGSITLVNNGWPKPSWQTGVSGIPSDGVRDIPDVSLFAGNGELGSATLVCVQALGSCVTSTTITAEPTAQELGGTSVGTPEMAGVMALINQKTGTAQGNPNAQLYALAAKQNYAGCSAESVKAGSTSCYFNDVDTGTIDMPCDYGATEGGVIGLQGGPTYNGIISPNCTVIHSGDTVGLLTTNGTTDAYNATAGFDLATGLGSMNVANIVNSFAPAGTGTATVTVTPATATVNSNASLNVTVSVASSAAGGTTPTGTVTLSGGGYSASAETLSSGSFTFIIPANTLTPGSDTLTADYSGDSNYGLASGTATVTVTQVAELTPTVSVSASPTSIESVQSLTVSGAVSGTGGTAAGTVVVTGGGYTSPAATLAAGQYSIVIPGSSLSAGSDVLTATYTPASGSIYSTATGTSAAVTVTASVFTVAASAPAAISSPGGSATSTVTVTAANGYAGTVTLTCTLASEASQGDIDPPSCSVGGGGTVTLSSGTTSGTAQVTVNSTASTGELVYPKLGGGKGWLGAGGGAVLALLMFLGVPARRRSWRTMVGMLVLMVMLGSLAGCGGGGGTTTPTGTTPDTYTFTVTATGSPAVTPTPSTSFSVTVN